MKSIQRVVWSEGMLVSPQHLQQSDLYHERLLNLRLAAALPQFWGVQLVQIDSGALGADQLVISRFSGIMPDGSPLDFSTGETEAPPTRPIGTYFPPTQPSLEVFLAIPKEREGVPSITAPLPDAVKPDPKSRSFQTRYKSSTQKVVDMLGNAADLEMDFAQRNSSILFGTEDRDDYDSIKVAEIVRDRGGVLVINDAYIPPVLTISASSFLSGGVQRLLGLMIAKQRQLSSERQQRDSASVDFSPNDVTRYLQLSALNTTIPYLLHASQSGDIGPRELYLYLIQAAGHLSTFATEADPSTFPPFIYTDLRTTFEELFALLTGLLRANLRDLCVRIPMEVRDGIHIGNLSDERALKCVQFVLAAQSSAPVEQLARELPNKSKIASWTQLPFLMRSATRGIILQVSHRPPADIPVKPGVVYFIMESSAEFWQHVFSEKKIAIYSPPPFDPSQVKLELFGIPGKT
jgi:type VI secretion system protein ImpJ